MLMFAHGCHGRRRGGLGKLFFDARGPVYFAWMVLGTLVNGCAAHGPSIARPTVGRELADRTGLATTCVEAAPARLPNGASLSDGLDEDEAVLMALWNNRAFRELLVDLDLAHADLVRAGLLPNPDVSYFFPVTDKPFKYAFEL